MTHGAKNGGSFSEMMGPSISDTCMHICILTAEHSAILLTFIKLPNVIKTLVLSFLSGCLKHILLYCLSTCTFCFVEFIDSL